MTKPYSSNEQEKLLPRASIRRSKSASSANPGDKDRISDTGRRDENGQQSKENAPPSSTPLISHPIPIAISMSGCGFLCSYHIGAMLCMQRHAKTLLSNVHMFCGASAGALIASIMVLAPDKLEDALKQIYDLAEKVPNILMYSFDKNFKIDQQLAELVDRHLPQDISAANSRLVISLTKQKDFSNRLINKYSDRDQLMQYLFASCYIPYYARNAAPIIDGEAYIDGGLSNNLPIISGMHTITISPYSGSAKIAPLKTSNNTLLNFDTGRQLTFGQQQLNITWENIVRIYRSLYPRPIFPMENNTVIISRYYEQGYRDTMNYLLRRGYYERSVGTEV